MADTTKIIGGNPIKLVDNGDGTFSIAANVGLPTGAATSAKQDTIITHVDGVETALTTLNAKDFATQTTLAAVLAKIIAAPATEAKQDTLIAKDFATQTTLAAILAKIIAAPATEATLASVQATLAQGGIPATTLETTHQNAATTDGNGTAATVSGYGPIAFQVTGTFDTATVTYKGSVDGTNYDDLPGTAAVTTAGISKFDVSGYKSNLAVISGAGASTSLTVKSLAVGVARPLTADVITVGKAADNAAANGNPVLLAGKYNATPTTRDEGDVVTLQTDAQGNLLTKLIGSKVAEGIADFVLNAEGTLLASAARTNTTTSPNMTNKNAKGILVSLNVTAVSGTGGLQVVVRGHDPVTGTVYWLNALPVAVVATGINVYEVCPAVNTAASGVKQRTSGELPRTWSVSVIHADGSSYTYSVGYSLGV